MGNRVREKIGPTRGMCDWGAKSLVEWVHTYTSILACKHRNGHGSRNGIYCMSRRGPVLRVNDQLPRMAAMQARKYRNGLSAKLSRVEHMTA